jgi:hypothetical protein
MVTSRFGFRRHLVFGLLLLIAGSLMPCGARADDPDVEAEHERGVQLREQHRDQEALDLFQALYDRTHEPRALARIALAEAALGQWDLAEEHMSLALQARRDRWIRRNRLGLRQNLALIREHVGSAEINCATPGATLLVRGQVRSAFPLSRPIRLPLGDTPIEVRAPGFQTARQNVTVSAGTAVQVVIALAPEAPPAAVVVQTPAPLPTPVAEPAITRCPEGQFITPDTAGHCCWPGQVYATSRDRCVGVPTCLNGFAAEGEQCVLAPTVRPSASDARAPAVVAEAAGTATPLPDLPRGASTETNRFQLTVSGGHGPMSDVFGPHVGGRLGYSIVGHVYVGVYGGYNFGTISDTTRTVTYAGIPGYETRAAWRSSWMVGPELGFEASPGRWILRASLAAVYLLADRTNELGSINDTQIRVTRCAEPVVSLLPGISILAPLTRALYLGVDARYSIQVWELDPCSQDRVGLSSDILPGVRERNEGVLVTGEFGLRL